MSTATDIGAPATEQGAGLLNVLAAVKEAKSIDGASGERRVRRHRRRPAARPQSDQRGPRPRRHRRPVGAGDEHRRQPGDREPVDPDARVDAGRLPRSATSACNPRTPTPGCPANTGTFPIWSGVNEVYQDENFQVPATTGLSRLEFAADYTYYRSVFVAPLRAHRTERDLRRLLAARRDSATTARSRWPIRRPGSGPRCSSPRAPASARAATVQWSASTVTYVAGGHDQSPRSLTIGPGQTGVAHLALTSSNVSGDASQSVVVSSRYGTNTVPVTVRTTIATDAQGGTFSGV